MPDHDTLLTFSGKIANTNTGDELQMGRHFLESLPQVEIVTHTPWQDGPQTFRGPLFKDVLAFAGLKSGDITAVASNNYQITFPIEDAHEYGVVLALTLNGKPMSLRNKGPLWAVYPWDDNKKLQFEEYYSRSIWQLVKIIAD